MSASGLSFLFINVSRIGDTLFATPAMRAVENAYPGCRMVVLGHPKRFDILRGLPFVKDAGSITKRRALWRGWFGGGWFCCLFRFRFLPPRGSHSTRPSR